MTPTTMLWNILSHVPENQPTHRAFWGFRDTGGDLELFTCGWYLRGFIIIAPLSLLLTLAPAFRAAVLVVILMVPVFLLVFHSTILGVWGAAKTAKAVALLHDSRRIATVATIPSGIIGMSWSAAALCFHRGDFLSTADRLVRRVLSVVILIASFALLLLGYQIAFSGYAAEYSLLAGNFIMIMGVAIGVWLDYRQSIVTAALAGLLIPKQTHRSDMAQAITIAFFLSVQLLCYLFVLVMIRFGKSFNLFLSEYALVQQVFFVAFVLLIYYALREGIVFGLWRTLLRQYGISAEEFTEYTSTGESD